MECARVGIITVFIFFFLVLCQKLERMIDMVSDGFRISRHNILGNKVFKVLEVK